MVEDRYVEALQDRTGKAMECAASLDVLKVRRLIDKPRYDQGIVFLEAVVAMLTKIIGRLVDVTDKGGAQIHGAVDDHRVDDHVKANAYGPGQSGTDPL